MYFHVSHHHSSHVLYILVCLPPPTKLRGGTVTAIVETFTSARLYVTAWNATKLYRAYHDGELSCKNTVLVYRWPDSLLVNFLEGGPPCPLISSVVWYRRLLADRCRDLEMTAASYCCKLLPLISGLWCSVVTRKWGHVSISHHHSSHVLYILVCLPPPTKLRGGTVIPLSVCLFVTMISQKVIDGFESDFVKWQIFD